MKIKLCKISNLLKCTDMLHNECSYTHFQSCIERFGIEENTLPVLDIRVVDTTFTRELFGRGLEIQEFRSLFGHDETKFTNVLSAVLPYEVVQQYHDNDAVQGLFFGTENLPSANTTFNELCNSLISDSTDQYFILVTEI